MHSSVFTWVREKVQQHRLDQPGLQILEVGAANVNGSIRECFGPASAYLGVDLREGPGVDLACSSHELEGYLDADSFDVAVSTETLEHDPAFWITVQQMSRVLKPGGYLLLTARGNGFPVHEHPVDCYRFLPSSMEYLLQTVAGCQILEIAPDPLAGHPGLFALGRKETPASPQPQSQPKPSQTKSQAEGE